MALLQGRHPISPFGLGFRAVFALPQSFARLNQTESGVCSCRPRSDPHLWYSGQVKGCRSRSCETQMLALAPAAFLLWSVAVPTSQPCPIVVLLENVRHVFAEDVVCAVWFLSGETQLQGFVAQNAKG